MKFTNIELEKITNDIKNQIASKNQDKNKEITDYIIKNKICKAFGYENINHFNQDIENKSILIIKNNKLRKILEINKRIVNDFLLYDIKLNTPTFFMDIHKKIIDDILINTYNYSLSQYMEMYEIINFRNIYNGIKVKKYKDLNLIIELFITDLQTRKKEASSLLFEEKIFKHRIEKGIRLTPCDKILKKIIESEYSEDSIKLFTLEINNELNRLKSINQDKERKQLCDSEEGDLINIFHFPKLIESLKKKKLKEDFVLAKENKLSKIHFIKNKKRKQITLSEKDMINGTIFMAGASGSSLDSTISLIINNNILKGDGFFYFDGENYTQKLLSIFKRIAINDCYSKIIHLTHENFMELSDEKIEEYVADNRMVYCSLLSFEKMASSVDKMKILHRIEYISNKISKVKKETGTTIVITDMDTMMDEKDKHSFFEDFEKNRKEKYIPSKMKFIFSAREYLIFKAEKYLDNIENVFLFNQEDPNVFYNHLIHKKGINEKSESNGLIFRLNIRDLKSLHLGEFFYLKNENGEIKMPIKVIFKVSYPNNYDSDYIQIDSNE